MAERRHKRTNSQDSHARTPRPFAFSVNVPELNMEEEEDETRTGQAESYGPSVQCSHCGELVHNDQVETHNRIFHLRVACLLCKNVCENVLMLSHHISTNHKTHTMCQSCMVPIRWSDLAFHLMIHS